MPWATCASNEFSCGLAVGFKKGIERDEAFSSNPPKPHATVWLGCVSSWALSETTKIPRPLTAPASEDSRQGVARNSEKMIDCWGEAKFGITCQRNFGAKLKPSGDLQPSCSWKMNQEQCGLRWRTGEWEGCR